MKPEEIINRYYLARIIGWRHELELLDAEAVAELVKALKIANNQLRERIKDELPKVWASYTPDKGGAAMRIWLGELLSDPERQIADTITEGWSISAQSSLAAYNDILSVQGQAKGIATIPITIESIRNLAKKKLFAGYSLNQLVKKAFTEGQIKAIVGSLDESIKKGVGYKKAVKDVLDTAIDEGFKITERESITLARSYIQQASVNAQLAVYERNKDVLKGVQWVGILDNKICPLCASIDGNYYEWGEERPPMPRHPRCMLPNTRVYAPDAIAAFKAEYDGPAYYFVLENGSYFYTTAHHPILTNKGFVPAHQIDRYSKIFCNEKHIGLGTPISDIYNDMLAQSGASEKIDISQASLHGDGFYSSDCVELTQNEFFPEVSKFDERLQLYEYLHCRERNRSIYELLVSPKNLLEWWSNGKSWLSLQNVKVKEKIHYRGPVYDLQTLTTLYYADIAIVSNCRCLWLPWVKSWRDLGIDADDLKRAARPWLIREKGNIDAGGRKVLKYGTSEEVFAGWWKTLDYEEQIQSIGPIRTKLIKEGKLTWKDLVNKNTGHYYTLHELGFDERGNPL